MNTPENDLFLQDIHAIAQSPELSSLPKGSSILVTGATGLLGKLAVRALACCGRAFRVIALVRSPERAQAVLGDVLDRIELCVADVTEPLSVEGAVDYILHGASPTDSRFFVEKPVQTIFTALEGTRNVLELAKEKQTKKVIYLSSLEVYGIPDGSKEWIAETDYGYLDPTQTRSSYSEGKRMAECICAAYYQEFGVPVCIARLSQTFGPGVSPHDRRVFAQFARCAAEGTNIVLHTRGNTVRSYCYTADAIRAIFTLLASGTPGEAYNVTNMDTAISIRDMAELVCSLVPRQHLQVRVEIPENGAHLGYNPEMILRLDSRKLQALGWSPQTGLADMLRRLIQSMKQE